MCYSAEGSLLFGVIGLLSSVYFYKKNIYASVGIGYFALMEILQFLQYRVIDQCNSNYNKFLTYIGYTHICFQPIFINIWLFAFTKKPNFTFIYMSIFAGLLLFSRIFDVDDSELCDIHNEPLCGKETCALSGEKHIKWNVRLRAAGVNWWSPSIALHFFMWVIPVLTIVQFKPILAMLFSLPYIAYLSIIINSDKKVGSEAGTIWCYTLIGQMLLSYILIK